MKGRFVLVGILTLLFAIAIIALIGLTGGFEPKTSTGSVASIEETPKPTPTPTPTPTPILTPTGTEISILWQDSGTETQVHVSQICIGDWCTTETIIEEVAYWTGELESDWHSAIFVTLAIEWRNDEGLIVDTTHKQVTIYPGLNEIAKTFYHNASVTSAEASINW